MPESKDKITHDTSEQKSRKAARRVSVLAFVCLLFLAFPNFNIIDFMPDFIPYLILARWFGRYSELVPYFEEAKNAFYKLTLVSLAKIPAMVIMLANMYAGRDIVALFTLVFITIELLLLFPAIRSSFAALTYVGERGDAPSTILPIKLFGRATEVDSLEKLSLIFVSVKAVLNLIPDFFLMSGEDTDAVLSMRLLFPIATLICMSIVLLFGIVWLIALRSYAVKIAREGKFGAAVREIAGTPKLEALDKRRSVKKMLFILTLLIPAALFNLELRFEGVNNGANIIPHFLLGIIAIAVALLLFTNEKDKRLALIFGVLFLTVSLYTNHLANQWHALYDYTDIGYITFATDAYITLEIFSVIELILAVALGVSFIRGFIGFVRENTLFSPPGAEGARVDRNAGRGLYIKTLVFLISPIIIFALKTANLFISGDVRYETVDSPEVAVGPIVTSSLPWFGTAITILTVIYAIYSYYYVTELKSEIKMKHASESESFE